MASDQSWKQPVDGSAADVARQADPQFGSHASQQPDPLEELARIMDQTNPRQAGSNPASQDDTADDDNALGFDENLDDFNALLANEGLVPDLPRDDVVADPYLDQQLMQPELSAEDLLADLNFGDLDQETQAASTPVAPPPLTQQAPAQQTPPPPPLISDYLSPRSETAQPADMRLDDNDLLAAMDNLELEEGQLDNSPLPEPEYSAPPLGAFAQEDTPSVAPLLAGAVSADDQARPDAPDQDLGYGTLSDDYFADLDRDVPPLPAPSEAMAGEAAEQQRSGGPGKMIVFGLAGFALLGVGAVVAFGLLGSNSSNEGAPQVIAAAEGDDKVEPETAEDTATRPGDAVFETLSDDARASVEEPRVVLPGPGSDSSVRSITPTADIAPAPPGSTASRPVRTVTVRADGTVVEAAPIPAAPAINTDVTVEAAQARPVQVVDVVPDILTPGTVSGDPISNASETIAAAAQSTLQASTQAVVDQVVVPNITPPQPVARPAIAPLQPAPTQPAPVQAVQVQPVQAQATPAQSAPAQSAQSQATQPIQLAAPAAAPAAVTPAPVAPAPQPVATAPATPSPAATQAAPTGDFVVQLASLRSPEQAQATFNTLQGRFGSILTGFSPDIQRADLGDRGIYHRLRVGPMDRTSANSLCQRYQAAGGDCIVQRR
ncbi:MAG: hypothetical protein Rhims3KO_29530 [Hyphomicrobiales bacterium]